MAKKAKNDKRTVIRITLFLLIIVFSAAAFKLYEDIFAGNVRQEANQDFIYWHTNRSYEENFDEIRKRHLLKNTDALKRMIRILGYEDMLKPGRYRLNESASNLDLMRMIVSGRQEPLDITFKYAERKTDLASFWAKNLELDSNLLLKLLNDVSMADSLVMDTSQTILLFIPNTYNFYWNTPADKLIQRMITEYQHFWDSTRNEKAERLHMTRAEIGIMASIVQKETAKVEEMPIIAGVYYNRLKHSMPLQADPTILYLVNDKSVRRVRGEMLNIESPYNTYRNQGLPPGPLCIPSVQSINAVLNMAKHDYLYFCAKEDFSGCHNFASTFARHQLNARKYQKELNKRAIK